MDCVQESPFCFRVHPTDSMRVPGVIYSSPTLLPEPHEDESLRQVANVAALPGIVEAAYAMPDMHWGYGFPIGGVAATDVENGGVVSPGGVGFDISCGVRLVATGLDRRGFADAHKTIMDELARTIPRGAGRGSLWSLAGRDELEPLLRYGSQHILAHGHGNERDLERCEDAGALDGVDTAQISDRAVTRGCGQLGSLGSGNHFLEIQAVDRVYDEQAARAFDIEPGQVCYMIHCGSRGLGHQVCTDHVRTMEHTMRRHGIEVPDQQLACAPVDSPQAQDYLAATAAAANYARANRQVLADEAARVFHNATGCSTDLVYDVSHNMVKLEHHDLEAASKQLCVHRKGATLALPPRDPRLSPGFRHVGQPVLVPGSMGTASYVLAGTSPGAAFHSACHGAGRRQSRNRAARSTRGSRVQNQLEHQGIAVRGTSGRGLAEETPAAYKDVSDVVTATEGAGLAHTVARLVPLGVLKG